MTESRKW